MPFDSTEFKFSNEFENELLIFQSDTIRKEVGFELITPQTFDKCACQINSSHYLFDSTKLHTNV